MHDNSADLATLLLQLEEQLLDPSTRRNPDALASLLAEDFREFGVSGRIFDRQQIIDELASESPLHITLSNAAFQKLGEGVALLTYRSTRVTPVEPAVHANRTSLWVKRGLGWQIVFHQGTRI